MAEPMQSRQGFEYVRHAAIGSHWSNRAKDGKHFKNYGDEVPPAPTSRVAKWMLTRLVNGIAKPAGGYDAFGKVWYAPCDMAESVARWRASTSSGGGGDGATVSAKDRVYWIGHASQLLCLANGINILFDPIFSYRASPVSFAGPARRFPPAATAAQLPPIHIVTISHNHYDHMDEDSVKAVAARFPDAHFVVPLKLDRFLREWGVPASSITMLDWYEACEVKGIRIGCTPAQHWGKHSAFDNNEVLWCGWCIGWQPGKYQGPASATEGSAPTALSSSETSTQAPEVAQQSWNQYKKYFFTGDTAYNADVHESIYAHFGAMDMAAIPIGAYKPRWFMSRAHVDPEHAVQIFRDQHIQRAMAVHWGTFELADEPLDEPPQVLRSALAAASLDENSFQAIPMGHHIDF
ncbi:Beta-lactamase superfamily domain containing protein [Novymonas esmeraldas]|uniref:Beta-lactamase superfamily domain containing protein n=1 Tax=Novymonas esmeraldas TaxID=1808958 RepID=A0AAW0EWW5_9TRYP